MAPVAFAEQQFGAVRCRIPERRIRRSGYGRRGGRRCSVGRAERRQRERIGGRPGRHPERRRPRSRTAPKKRRRAGRSSSRRHRRCRAGWPRRWRPAPRGRPPPHCRRKSAWPRHRGGRTRSIAVTDAAAWRAANMPAAALYVRISGCRFAACMRRLENRRRLPQFRCLGLSSAWSRKEQMGAENFLDAPTGKRKAQARPRPARRQAQTPNRRDRRAASRSFAQGRPGRVPRPCRRSAARSCSRAARPASRPGSPGPARTGSASNSPT